MIEVFHDLDRTTGLYRIAIVEWPNISADAHRVAGVHACYYVRLRITIAPGLMRIVKVYKPYIPGEQLFVTPGTIAEALQHVTAFVRERIQFDRDAPIEILDFSLATLVVAPGSEIATEILTDGSVTIDDHRRPAATLPSQLRLL